MSDRHDPSRDSLSADALRAACKRHLGRLFGAVCSDGARATRRGMSAGNQGRRGRGFSPCMFLRRTWSNQSRIQLNQ